MDSLLVPPSRLSMTNRRQDILPPKKKQEELRDCFEAPRFVSYSFLQSHFSCRILCCFFVSLLESTLVIVIPLIGLPDPLNFGANAFARVKSWVLPSRFGVWYWPILFTHWHPFLVNWLQLVKNKKISVLRTIARNQQNRIFLYQDWPFAISIFLYWNSV